MSKLSELLNPAPRLALESSVAKNQHLDSSDVSNSHHRSDHNMRPANIYTGAAPRRPSITSPLDALAEAATSSAPLPSPSSTKYVNHHQNASSSSSRPTSSHTPPSRAFELPPVPQQSAAQSSPGLDQYHHSSSIEVRARRLSEATDGESRVLPPIRSRQEENVPPPAVSELQTRKDDNTLSTHGTFALPPPYSSHFEPSRPIPEPLSPVTDQIRQPSPGVSYTAQESNLPDRQADQVRVKTEIAEAPIELPGSGEQETMPTTETTTASYGIMGEAPALNRSVADLRSDASHRLSPTVSTTDGSPQNAPAKSKSAPPKKRAAPKKGTASTVKPAAKKRKVDNDNAASSPALPRMGTPNSSRASKTPAPRGAQQGSVTPAPKGGQRSSVTPAGKGSKQGSITPARSSSVANANDEDGELDEGDSSELFCICRKPDDHTWMIGCDGPCEDWFHGHCINMTEKEGKLIEKYFCPNCVDAGVGETLWKPMCRLETCREPARATGSKPSKYCCDEHGAEFMRRHALKDEPEQSRKPTSPVSGRRRSRKCNYTDNFGNGSILIQDETDDESYLRGGVLRAADLKTLASCAKDITDFRRLGEGVFSQPQTVGQEGDTIMEDASPHTIYTPEESQRVSDIQARSTKLRQRKQMLDDRETFLTIAKARAKAALPEKKSADFLCGFDRQLVWTDEEFDAWRTTPEGQRCLQNPSSSIENIPNPAAPPPPTTTTNGIHPTTQPPPPPTIITNGENGNPPNEAAVGGAGTEDPRGMMCVKKRCKRHEFWQKLQTQEIAFEKDVVRQEMRMLIAEENGIKERATLRALEEEEE